jgi:hypothetical protein
MIKKPFVLAGLAALALGSPVTSPETPMNTLPETGSSPDLAARDNGVWLDLYSDGSCKSGWSPQPTSGWLWAGQCKNIDSGTYGARLGNNHNGWPWCKLKFWEKPDCHGHATATYVKNNEVHKKGGFYGDYQCIAAANRDGQFYLTGGATSVELIC